MHRTLTVAIEATTGPCDASLRAPASHLPKEREPGGLVAHLPAVTVRAVEHVSPPALHDTGDVRKFIAHSSGHDDPAGREHVAAPAVDDEPWVDADDVIDELDAVAAGLAATGSEQLARRHPVAGQEAVHLAGRSVAWRAGVDHRDRSPGRPRTSAADRPAAPPPTMTTS
jgi:hypothetical protein